MIPYGRQDVTDADIDSVVRVLRSDFLTQGPAVPRFEQAVAQRVGAQHAVAVNSATSALHIACAALGLGPGDWLWTSPNTFVASANCGLYCGAQVDFVDINPVTWSMSTERLREKLVSAKKTGKLPKVVVPVHFAGHPSDQEHIWALAQEFGFKVLEDASHAIGAARDGQPVGNCRWSDVTVFSFHPVKIITSGEGGMALTNDGELAARMEMLRTHGITRKPERFLQTSAPPWHYEQQLLGFNYRMTDIQAVLGLSQLQRLTEYVARRNMLAHRYDTRLRDLALQLPFVQPGTRSAFHLYVIRVKPEWAGPKRASIFEELRNSGVGVNVHYTPVHLQPYYRQLGFAEGQFPESEAYGQTAITLPLFPGLTDEMQDNVAAAVAATLESRRL
jgi:UDP-4-amino-4,6-dideoxy-N-acetyl-beta-L-altrosamine transaminase